MTPVAPTYTEARDAPLALMFATDQADYDLAVAAFARDGMGFGAVSPDRDSTDLEGVVESFATELPAYSASGFDREGGLDADDVGFGAEFTVGYSGSLLEGPAQSLSNRQSYSGLSSDFGTFAGDNETVSFGDALNGQSVRFRLRVASDSNTADFGWVIDNVSFTNIVSPIFSEVIDGERELAASGNSLPKLTLSDTELTINEGEQGTLTVTVQDRNAGDTLSCTPAAVTASGGVEARASSSGFFIFSASQSFVFSSIYPLFLGRDYMATGILIVRAAFNRILCEMGTQPRQC